MAKSGPRGGRPRKRAAAVGYGCYPVDADTDDSDIEADAKEVERKAVEDDKASSRRILEGIRMTSKGAAMVGRWEPLD